MKKFYIPIFTSIFLLSSLFSQAQYANTYTTIANDGAYHSINNPATWIGGLAGQPPVPCTSCLIIVNCLTTLDFIPGYFQYVELINSKVLITPGNSLAINTAFRLTNSTLFVGNTPTAADTLFANAQVDLDATSSITIANGFSYIDATDPKGVGPVSYPGNHYAFFQNPKNPLIGVFNYPVFPGYGPYFGDPLAVALGGPVVYQYAYTLTQDGIGTPESGYAQYNINCAAPAAQAGCQPGQVFGPATTSVVIDPVTPTSPGNQHLEFISSTVLPVQLVQFLATKNDDGTIQLSWATSQEQNASNYNVERSGDQSGWTTLGTVKAKGYSSTTTNYKYTDQNPVKGTGYYRLKMVDLDGKFTYSKTVSVTSDNDSRPLVIYSNPFNDQIRMKVNVSRAQNLVMTVSDMLGKNYISKSYQAQSGDNYVNLLPGVGGTGMYILHIHGDSYDQTIKLEKQ